MFKPSKRVEGAHSAGIWCVGWSGSSNIITGSLEGNVKLWNSELKLTAESQTRLMGITSVCSFKDGSKAVASCQDGSISFMETEKLSDIATIQAGVQEAWTSCLSPTEEVVASGSHRGQVKIWSATDFREGATLETNCGFILNSAFSSDASKLATVGIDGVLNIFDVATQSVTHKIDAHSLPTRCVKFMPEGNLILTASDDRHVSAHDARTGTVINSFSHAGMALSVDIAPDQRHFAVGCSNHTVSIWDIGMQRSLHNFDSQHSESVWGVSFNSSGQRLASVGDDGLLQLYDC